MTTHPSWAERALGPGSEVVDGATGARYEVVGFLGRGGMGEVHEVREASTGARYALKCLLLQHARRPKTIERTRREALTLRELRHPNVVRVHATGVREDGLIWMVMDLLQGHTLAAVKRALGKLPLRSALAVGSAVAAGLSAVHEHAVHRDVKPDNIHLGDDGVVRVLDLGAGKFHRSLLVTTADRTLGTVPYMSPEQLSVDASVDGRSDLFSLGTVLAEIISGVHPFAPAGLAHENVFTLVRRIVMEAPPSLGDLAPWVPAHVVVTVDRALRRDREQRYESAAAFGAALAADIDRVAREGGPDEPLRMPLDDLRDGAAPPAGAGSGALPSPPPASTETVDDEADTCVMVRER
jgi:serine/threonine-protein kinase